MEGKLPVRNDGGNKSHSKVDFKQLKIDTICSLNDVEFFLNNFCRCYKYVRLIKLLK